MKLFKRNVKLVIYADDKPRTVTDLHLDFDISASTDRDPNTAKITVWNLNDETCGVLTDSHQAIEFYAGYQDKTNLIFAGETSNVIHSRVGTDRKTEIYAGEGLKNYETMIFNKSYSAGTLIRTIFQDMADKYGLPSTIDDPLFEDKTLKGVTYSGRVKDCLTVATKDYRFTWSVQRGILEILYEGNFLSSDPLAVVLRSDTGMLDSPAVTTRSSRGGKNIQGVRVTSLLNPDLIPGRLIQIESVQTTQSETDLFKKKQKLLNADGVYFAQRLRYYGNNYGGPFAVEIEADLT